MARYPELLGFGSTVVVPASQLSAYEAHVLADPSSGLAPSAQPFVVIPPGNRSYYCFSVIGSARNALDALPLGYDLCGGTQGKSMLLARDSGQTDLQPFTVKGITDISIAVPIYRGTSTPQTVAARRKAFVGWVGMSLVPGVILTTALSGHPNTSVVLRFGGAAKAEFRSGVAPTGAQTERFDLHDGWTVQTFAAVGNTGLLGNASALALLIAGIALGLLLGALIYLLGTGRARAIKLVEERTDEIRFRALHDSLTGLPNRALILDRVDQMLPRARRSLAPTAAMFLDLDNFKDINDTMGHQAGDQLLVAVSKRLTMALRDSDTIGRLGGDEFVLLVEGNALSAGVGVVAERILDVLRPPFEIEASDIPISTSASIGIAEGDRLTAEDLLRDADIALYRAKAAGKHCAVVFEPMMQTAAQLHRDLAIDLHGALESGQFFLLYQPTIDLQTNAFTGVEALLRWNHPERGVVQPDDFIPELEMSGLIVPVGAWVLEEACRQGAEWHARGHRFTVSVNVSAKQLMLDRIVSDVELALSSSGFDPRMLILELTETTLMRDVEKTVTRLMWLRALGVRIAVDDFGTGYSSLAYLRKLPIDILKIDRSFVSGITDSAESAALVHTLVQLGKALKLETIAEGVEDEAQRMQLREENVDTGQGFLFARPLDVAAVNSFLEGFAAGVSRIGSRWGQANGESICGASRPRS